MEHEEDQLSSLPKIILHNILSSLPEKDAARTSVLCKTWLETWYTFPILSFCDDKIIGKSLLSMEDIVRKKYTSRFCDYVNKRMLCFYDQNLTIKEFKLKVIRLHDMSKNVNVWLKLACESGVQVIELSQWFGESPEQYYVLPMSVIFLSKSLTKLVLKRVIRVDPIFMNGSIKIFSLRVLSLLSICLGDKQEIERLISCCPLIEYITLEFCTRGLPSLLESSTSGVMNSVSMSGLQKLKQVQVSGIQEVFIDASSLEKLWYCPGDSNIPCMIDFDRCMNLKELCLRYMTGTLFTDKWFLELFPKFPFLESLKLQNCTMSEMIYISSVQLKVLGLSNCINLKEVNIDAPNLLLCGYCGRSIPIISFLRSSSQLEVLVEIHIDYLHIFKLRGFLQNIKPQNVLISLSLFIYEPPELDPLNQMLCKASSLSRLIYEPPEFDPLNPMPLKASLFIYDPPDLALNPMVLEASSPPPSIKHLDLCYAPKNETLFSSLVNILLLICCPATIYFSLIKDFLSQAFVKFFYKTLMRRKENKCFCSSRDIKCWWHELKDVKSTSYTERITPFRTVEWLPAVNIKFSLEF